MEENREVVKIEIMTRKDFLQNLRDEEKGNEQKVEIERHIEVRKNSLV